MKENSQVVHQLTLQPLTKEELNNQEDKVQGHHFNEAIHWRLGPATQEGDLAADEFKTPTIAIYGNDDDGNKRHVSNVDDHPQENARPHVIDAYINEKVTLPIGGKMRSD